jgi:hypothetical protein
LRVLSTTGADIGRPQGTGIIFDDDGSAPPYNIGEMSVVEGDNGKPRVGRLAVTLPHPVPAGPNVVLNYIVKGQPIDVKVKASGTLVFKPGQWKRSIAIREIPDVKVEPDAYVEVDVSDPTSFYPTYRATLTIINDDVLEIYSVEPTSGPVTGHNGRNLTDVTRVTFGGINAEIATRDSDSKLTVVNPPYGAPATVDVVAYLADGTSSPIVPEDHFTYEDVVGPPANPFPVGYLATYSGSDGGPQTGEFHVRGAVDPNVSCNASGCTYTMSFDTGRWHDPLGCDGKGIDYDVDTSQQPDGPSTSGGGHLQIEPTSPTGYAGELAIRAIANWAQCPGDPGLYRDSFYVGVSFSPLEPFTLGSTHSTWNAEGGAGTFTITWIY